MQLAAPDFRIDLSLHFLSLLVSGAIALALIWYLVVILSPLVGDDAPLATAPAIASASEEVGPPAWVALDHRPPLLITAVPPVTSTVVTVFRCEANGQITYADHPCERGGVRILRLPVN
jgi:hypothetical protein